MRYPMNTLAEKPSSRSEIDRLNVVSWPRFLLHAQRERWDSLFSAFADAQVLFFAPGGELAAVGHAVPIPWDGTTEDLPLGLNGALARAALEGRQSTKPTALCALAAMVDQNHRNQGLSTEILRAMKTVATSQGLQWLIAPVRPTLKHLYPLTPMARYTQWTRPDGSPFDPWIRTHWKLGAQPLGLAPRVLTVTGTVADWETWTNLRFPDSGDYIVAGAMQPVRINRERNEGSYEETGFWMCHPLQPRPD